MSSTCTKIVLANVTIWKNKDELTHRDNDLPATIYKNGDKRWYKEGQLHRENNLPAIELSDGTKKWYINGNSINPTYIALSFSSSKQKRIRKKTVWIICP